MTKPDEALLWAREHWATRCDEGRFPEVAEAYRRGDRDEFLREDIEAYRAGAAASEARIKALEGAIRDANKRLKDYSDMTVDQWGETVADGGITAWMVTRQELQTVIAGGLARALLKEDDQ